MRRTGLSDTSPEAARVLTEAYRAMSPARKWQLLADAQRMARVLHEAGIRRDDPAATPGAIHRSWLVRTLGATAQLLDERSVIPLERPIEHLNVIRDVADAFTELGIAYALGGSLASSIYGNPRYTSDADMSAEPFLDRVGPFVARFNSDYYVSRSAIEQAIRDRSTFNIIHVPAGFKVDVFIERDRAFDRSILERRRPHALLGPPARPIDLVSPEDVVLLKLEWYRLGGESSDRQWSDILGVLRVRSGQLEDAYMDRWAAELGMADLLARARAEVSI